MDDRYVTVPEVARYIGRSPRHVYDLINRSDLPAVKLAGKVRVMESDVLAYIREHTTKV